MNEFPSADDDLCDGLLARPVAGLEDAALRQAILGQTSRVLRRRRQLRTLRWLPVLAACYLLGWLTPGWHRSDTEIAGDQQPVVKAEQQVAPVTATAENGNTSADEDRWVLVTDESKRAEVYREAGDRYFREGDYQAATHCYKYALENSPEEALSPTTDDNFLLLAMKDARQKEKRDANNED